MAIGVTEIARQLIFAGSPPQVHEKEMCVDCMELFK